MRKYFQTKKSSAILSALAKMTKEVIDTNQGRLADVPDKVIAVSLFMAINAIIQAVADIGIEVLALTKVIPSLPFRFEFLCLADFPLKSVLRQTCVNLDLIYSGREAVVSLRQI